MGRVRGRPWIEEHAADPYVKRARAQGLRSRAAFKLEEIARRDRLLAPGMVVIDLGASPGSWSQVAAARVGASGRVIALDRLEMAPVPGVTFIRGDFLEPGTLRELERALGGERADLVLSDLAPNWSGIASSDRARALELAERALEFALKHLKPQGNFLVKTFQGEGFEAFQQKLGRHFRQVVARKPGASRARSSEIYLLAKGLRAPGAGAADTPRART
jgi:23S rRNA (uridine2552-2'-O)-methyltransferase